MEDQDRETRIDEDVEGHSHKGSHKPGQGRGDDEAHEVAGMHNRTNDERQARSSRTTRATTSRAHKQHVNKGTHKA